MSFSIPGIPKSLRETDALLADLDACLMGGFARLGENGKNALSATSRVFNTSPLGENLAGAVEELIAGRFSNDAFAMIAAARTALFGAQYDALAGEIANAIGVEFLPVPETTYSSDQPEIFNSFQTWLTELAINGFRQLDLEAVSPMRTTLATLLEQNGCVRLCMLMAGFVNELEVCSPIAGMPELPVRRWADFWARAFVCASGLPEPVKSEWVSGKFHILGTDIREHGNSARIQVHGVLDRGNARQCVCVNLAAFKVDTITGAETWKLFAAYPKLLQAIAEWRTIKITDMDLTADGNLIWDEDMAELEEPADPFGMAAEWLPCPQAKIPPADRHPALVAAPVFTDNCRIEEKEGEAHLNELKLTFQGAGAASTLSGKTASKAASCIGLLRFDGGRWELQPLTMKLRGKKMEIVHNGAAALGPPVKSKKKPAKSKKKPADALSILRERAGKLLRK